VSSSGVPFEHELTSISQPVERAEVHQQNIALYVSGLRVCAVEISEELVSILVKIFRFFHHFFQSALC
jgi:hypothetical protein